ncbi:MAG TPA: cytochrome c3 family protein, partial [Candidatus Methanoperedens sp.]|nr:cytochrome c3 family protein [Candidatus Methanoperedens sp.]
MADTQNYSPVTKACILCHNDTTYPNDTDGDGRAAPFKRPHNDTIMCEKCHLTNPHTVAFIQPDGSYGIRSTAASCPECHQAGIPAQNNNNFTTAPIIFSPLRHSSNILNGSVWGNYWAGATPKTACYYCHGDLHTTRPLGRILSWYPNYQLYGSIGTNLTCAGCHYKGSPNYSQMRDAFASAGLPQPPEITNGTNWNGIDLKYYNHTLDSYNDQTCRTCHGALLSENANIGEFVHNVAEGPSGEECLSCHISRQNIYPAINRTSFGSHININKTGGENNLTNDDCLTCHYNFNYTVMAEPGFTTPTYNCTDCHINGNFSAPLISNHRPPRLPERSPGAYISTTAYCSVCHNNSINRFAYSVNASVGHYGTNTSLIKPTVNQTPLPRFGFVNSADASAYNKDCNRCHNPSNPNYGS